METTLLLFFWAGLATRKISPPPAPCYRPSSDCSLDPSCFLSSDGDQMESGSASPPRFLVSTQLSQALTMLQEGPGSLRALPPREPPSLPACPPPPPLPRHRSCRTCRPCPSRKMAEPRRGWAHTQHSGITGRALSEQMEKSEDTPFPKFLF